MVERLFTGQGVDERPYPPTYRRFFRSRQRHHNRSFRIVGCKSTDQGSLNIVSALHDVYEHFAPRVVCLVGIAGALDEELEIGDVIVATQVYWYERGKERDDHTDRELRPFSLRRPTLNLVDSVVGDMRRQRNDLRIVLGSYGTGEKVVASDLSGVRSYLYNVDRKVMAVEMESGGFFHFFEEAAFRGPDDIWLVVKGISDHANRDKGDGDQPLAAVNSVKAAFALGCEVLIQMERAAF